MHSCSPCEARHPRIAGAERAAAKPKRASLPPSSRANFIYEWRCSGGWPPPNWNGEKCGPRRPEGSAEKQTSAQAHSLNHWHRPRR
jgi:hypothetical protein